MAGPARRRTGTNTIIRTTGASRRASHLRRKKPASLTPRDERLKERWDQRVDPVIAEWRKRPTKGVSPYDQKENYLRREIYRIICNLRSRAEGKAILGAAVLGHCGKEPTRLTVSQNPFFWGLKALAARIGLKPDRISRLSKEMLYAWRHDIEPDLLIGFILQTGAARIYEKSETEVEPWLKQ